MSTTQTYIGWRGIKGIAQVCRVDSDNAAKTLPLRLDLDNHSPAGFEWGYGGSGPAQLALAILADVLADDERAIRLHQRFKRRVIETFPRGGRWTLNRDEVLAHIAELEKEDQP